METSCANDVELGGEVLTPGRHKVKRVSKGNIVEHNVGHHNRHDQNGSNCGEPVRIPGNLGRRPTQHNLGRVVIGRKVASKTHGDVKAKHKNDRTADNFHKSIFNRVLQFLIHWQHIALVCEGEENDSCSVEKLGRKTGVGHFETVVKFGLVIRNVERHFKHDHNYCEHKTTQGHNGQVFE